MQPDYIWKLQFCCRKKKCEKEGYNSKGRSENNFCSGYKSVSALLPFLYLSFYHWKMMALTHAIANNGP